MSSTLSDDILGLLVRAGGEPLSGQGLADALGVTRAAVWKSVEQLREQGRPIESLKAKGYRLDPADYGVHPGELRQLLATERFGRWVRYSPSTESTNRDGAEWARQGGVEGALVVTDHQTAGRGRKGRSWIDTPGEAVLSSLILKPDIPAVDAPLLTLVAGVSVAETFADWVEVDRVGIKWPNDVMVDGLKAAGILLETQTEGQEVNYVVVGVGINVAGVSGSLPAEVRERATSLTTATGAVVSRGAFLSRYLERFEPLYKIFLEDGFGALAQRWNEWFTLKGKEIKITNPAGVVTGRAMGISPDGALVLETTDGGRKVVYAGDIEASTTRDK